MIDIRSGRMAHTPAKLQVRINGKILIAVALGVLRGHQAGIGSNVACIMTKSIDRTQVNESTT